MNYSTQDIYNITDIQNIITNYVEQLEFSEHQEKFIPIILELQEEMVEYLNPKDMKEMWGGRTIFHSGLTVMRYPSGKLKWCRNMEYRNWDNNFDECRYRLECKDCGLNIPNSAYNQERYPNALGCCNIETDCENWFCGCEGRDECDCESED